MSKFGGNRFMLLDLFPIRKTKQPIPDWRILTDQFLGFQHDFCIWSSKETIYHWSSITIFV